MSDMADLMEGPRALGATTPEQVQALMANPLTFGRYREAHAKVIRRSVLDAAAAARKLPAAERRQAWPALVAGARNDLAAVAVIRDTIRRDPMRWPTRAIEQIHDGLAKAVARLEEAA